VAKPQIPVGTAKVEVTGTYGPTTWANVFYVLIDAGSSTPGDVIAAVVEWFQDLYDDGFGLDELSTAWAHSFTTVTYRDAEDSIVRLKVADAQAGTNSSGDQDAQVAYLVNWATGDPRRGGKPRTYITGVPDNRLLDQARVAPGVRTTINGRLATWLTSELAAPIPMQLVEMSFRNGNADRAEAVTFPIIGGTLSDVVATQRRRIDRLR
jgi:hypothetical protein